ncbi:putative phosphatase [Beggiatoa alba B18LD]|uniref:Putative phosphatase n=1 Tax=Beggiatoa alba B18LD TaxID=395493 RepID=I3CGI1_9GAMM|nr:PhoX family phosphatase [Beggiatoa alba]EIJ42724.1 putative phosphatase [Beggiatoa alba B18LD]
MKDRQFYDLPEEIGNPHPNNPHFNDILEIRLSRRQVLQGSLGLAITSMFGVSLAGCNSDDDEEDLPSLGFKSVPVSAEDKHVVPEGYSAKVLYRWGDPVSDGPAFRFDASNTAAEQMVQAGAHHDGMHYFPIDQLTGGNSSSHGLLVMNHEYIDDALLNTTGGYRDDKAGYTIEKANKEMAAHGVSVIEVRKSGSDWVVVRPSNYARRISTHTPMTLSGPAAGSRLMQTSADATGREVIGTINNCANGMTPWGTYLTCEENYQNYFIVPNASELTTEMQAIISRDRVSSSGTNYSWEVHYDRFNVNKEPHEVNRFGWVVEIDPFNPTSKPIKRTALGRFSHENAAYVLTNDNRVVVYLGDDKTNEFIYKFVSNRAYDKNNRTANMAVGTGILDDGILYVAQYKADGTGVWLPLIHGQNGLTAENGFADQAEVLIKTRIAATLVGATPMDRPEWVAINPKNKQVYITLTNNSGRGTTNNPATDAANPRAKNIMGHILRWTETNNDPAALTMKWDIYVLAGNPSSSVAENKGNIKGDIFACPDGLWFDDTGRLWIQTDMSDSVMLDGEMAAFGNNQMLASDPTTGEIRRFFTGPIGCEVTGVITTPDQKTMFINIQHPGDVPKGLQTQLGTSRPTPANPHVASNWPDFESNGRPRSSTIVITKNNSGKIGS